MNGAVLHPEVGRGAAPCACAGLGWKGDGSSMCWGSYWRGGGGIVAAAPAADRERGGSTTAPLGEKRAAPPALLGGRVRVCT